MNLRKSDATAAATAMASEPVPSGQQKAGPFMIPQSGFDYDKELAALQVRLSHVPVPRGAKAGRWDASWNDASDAVRTVEWPGGVTTRHAGVAVEAVQDSAGCVGRPCVAMYSVTPAEEMTVVEARELAAGLLAAADTLERLESGGDHGSGRAMDDPMTDQPTGHSATEQGPASPRAQVFHVELDISTDYRNDHEAFVIIDALTEYASTQRWRAEDDVNAEFHVALADTANRLREHIDAQMATGNMREAAR